MAALRLSAGLYVQVPVGNTWQDQCGNMQTGPEFIPADW